MKVNICFACDDDDYVQHLSVAISSIINNTSSENELDFYVMTNYMSEATQNKIALLKKGNCNFRYIYVDKGVFKDCPKICSWTNFQTYYRLIMATLLPDIDKIIYLDSDLVVNVDIEELFNEDIEDYCVAGVDDIRYYHTKDDGHIRPYFNAGVLLFNLKKIREENIEQQFFDFIMKNQSTGLLLDQDQAIINYVLESKIKSLDFKWNVQSYAFISNAAEYHPLSENIKKAKKKPAIIHYTGSAKPWLDYTVPYARLYMKYLQFTPFNDRLNQWEFFWGEMKSLLYKMKKHPWFFMEDKITFLPQVVAYKESKNSKYVELLKKNGLQKKLNKYKNKKIIIYGVGLIFDLMWQNFDFNDLDIIAFADIKFDKNSDKFCEIETISPGMIAEKKPDLVLITAQNYMFIEDYIEDKLFKEGLRFKYKSLLAYNFGEFLRSF